MREKRSELFVSLQPVWTQEPKKFVRQTSGPYINDEGLNHYTSGLRDEM